MTEETSTFICMQKPADLLEYSMIAVTEGIDAIATTRVLIRGEARHPTTHALTGETVYRTFRYVKLRVHCSGVFCSFLHKTDRCMFYIFGQWDGG